MQLEKVRTPNVSFFLFLLKIHGTECLVVKSGKNILKEKEKRQWNYLWLTSHQGKHKLNSSKRGNNIALLPSVWLMKVILQPPSGEEQTAAGSLWLTTKPQSETLSNYAAPSSRNLYSMIANVNTGSKAGATLKKKNPFTHPTFSLNQLCQADVFHDILITEQDGIIFKRDFWEKSWNIELKSKWQSSKRFFFSLLFLHDSFWICLAARVQFIWQSKRRHHDWFPL